MLGHHLDIAHWGLGFDLTGPVEISGKGDFPTTGIYNSPTRYWVEALYADGTPLIIAGGYPEIQSGTKWIGERGWVWVDRGGLESQPASLVNEIIGPNEIKLYRSRDHYQNFVDCVRSRETTIASAALRSADGLAGAKNPRAAATVYDRLLAEKTFPAPMRSAAMIGKLATAGDQAAALVIEQMKSQNADMQEAAIGKIKDVFKPETIGRVSGLLSSLPENSQVKLIAVLAAYPKDRVLSTVLKAAQGESAPVRMAAFKTLERVGDASTVPFLLNAASKTRGPEQSAARNAIALIQGKPADDAILALLAQKPAEDVQVEVLLAIAERRIYFAKSAVAASLVSPSSRVRIQALRSLRTVGTPSDMPAVLNYLLACGEDSEVTEGTATIAALAQKIANVDGRSNAIKDMLGQTKDPKARARMINLLGRIGDDSSLPVLRAALTESSEETVDAAVRVRLPGRHRPRATMSRSWRRKRRTRRIASSLCRGFCGWCARNGTASPRRPSRI